MFELRLSRNQPGSTGRGESLAEERTGQKHGRHSLGAAGAPSGPRAGAQGEEREQVQVPGAGRPQLISGPPAWGRLWVGATWPDFHIVSIRLAVMSAAPASQLPLQQIELPLSGNGSALGPGGAGDISSSPADPLLICSLLGFAPKAAGRSQYLEASEPAGALPGLVITEQSLGEPQRAMDGEGPPLGTGA